MTFSFHATMLPPDGPAQRDLGMTRRAVCRRRGIRAAAAELDIDVYETPRLRHFLPRLSDEREYGGDASHVIFTNIISSC